MTTDKEKVELRRVLQKYSDEELKDFATELGIAQQPELSRDEFIEYLVDPKCIGCGKNSS